MSLRYQGSGITGICSSGTHFYPYKMEILQELHEDDPDQRIQFCEEIEYFYWLCFLFLRHTQCAKKNKCLFWDIGWGTIVGLLCIKGKLNSDILVNVRMHDSTSFLSKK